APTLVPIPINPTPTLRVLSLDERNRVFEQTWALVRDKWLYNDTFRGLNWRQVHDDYAPRVASAGTPQAFYALMSQMIDLLGDNHSAFFSPQQAFVARERAAGTGAYAGIGVELTSPEEGLII